MVCNISFCRVYSLKHGFLYFDWKRGSLIVELGDNVVFFGVHKVVDQVGVMVGPNDDLVFFGFG